MANRCWQFIVTVSLCWILFHPHNAFASDLKMLWTIENTFKLPESATFDSKRNQIYVSNIVKYAKDGTGFISRIDADGKNLELMWITNLNSPTGLAVYQDLLYAVDMDALVIIDLNKGRIVSRVEAPVSEKPHVLNDVAISKQGNVYISGSASRKIYKLENKALVVFVDDQERLLKANGLLVDEYINETNPHLIHGGQYWSRYSLENAKLLANDIYPRPDPQLFDFDGITHDGNGGYFVTVIEDPRLWHITKAGETRPITQEKIRGIDIHFDKQSRRLFVPRVGGSLTVFRVD